MYRITYCRKHDPRSKLICLICKGPPSIECRDCPDCNLNLAAADDATWD